MAAIPFSQKKFLFVFIAWWLIWTAMQTWILYGLDFSLQLSIKDSFLSNLLLAGACILISNNLTYYLPQQQRYGYLLALCLLTAGAWLLAIKYMLPNAITNNENAYDLFLTRSLPVRFGVAFLVIGCMAMISVLWHGFEDQKTSVQRKTEAEQLTKDAELYKLRQQLQPHFLFNSLNSINALIGTRPQEARTMVNQLSDFLRGTLKREEQQWIMLEEELEYLRLYLDIEKVRFGNRLSTIFETAPDSLQMKIPAMLLQPLVENAIKFGLYDTTGDTVIRIVTGISNSMLVVTVQNPFDEETAQPRQGTGFGLHFIQRRLYLLFARNDLLVTNALNHTFTTTVKIPQPLAGTAKTTLNKTPGNNKV
ncbi:MAG TPA: histidine kinase [Chitinophagaceae bacterium]|nr:histidine kinase [Chitinophagaceae bacterium]